MPQSAWVMVQDKPRTGGNVSMRHKRLNDVGGNACPAIVTAR